MNLRIFGLAFVAALKFISVPANAQSVPHLATSHPRDGSVVSAPIEQINLAFSGEVDLTYLEVIAPDGTKIVLLDIFERGDEGRHASSFSDSLPEPLTQPGDYRVNFDASVTNGNSTSTIAGSTDFKIADASGAESGEAAAEPAEGE